MARIDDDPMEAYQRYLRKGNYKKAIRNLEYLISQYPKDIERIREVEDAIKYGKQRKIHQGLAAALGGKINQFKQPVKSTRKAVSPSKQARAKKKAAKLPQKPAGIAPSPVRIDIPTYKIPVRMEPLSEDLLTSLSSAALTSFDELRLCIDYHALAIQGGFDELLCLSATNNVDRYWYQIETIKKVLKRFHGRALLCDEVGLGKTIEAGMLIKEYLLRGEETGTCP